MITTKAFFRSSPELDGLENAATSTRECANIYLTMCDKSAKNLIPRNHTQALKREDFHQMYILCNNVCNDHFDFMRVCLCEMHVCVKTIFTHILCASSLNYICHFEGVYINYIHVPF